MKTYLVKRPFWLRQQFIEPAGSGQSPREVSMTEREARYHLLAGDIETPASTDTVEASSNVD